MMRVKDPAKSLHFYRDLMGMTLIAESHYSDFSLYFLACANQNPVLAEAIAANTLPKADSPEAKVRFTWTVVYQKRHTGSLRSGSRNTDK